MRCLPNLVIAAPSDEQECRLLLSTAWQHPGPAAVRYPRGTGPGAVIERTLDAVPLGKGVIRRSGEQVAILNFGARLGQGAALCLQRRKQRRVLIRNQRLDHIGRAGGFHRVAAQGDVFLAPQDGAGGIGHAQRAMAVRVGADQIAPHHLPEHRPPSRFRQFAPDGKGRQLVMPAFANLIGRIARQNIDQMACAKPFACPQDG